MKIRDKLLLGFSLYIFTAIIFVFFSYKEIQAITMRFSYVEVVDDINNEVLEVRRSEKNFFLFTNEESLKEMRRIFPCIKQEYR